MRFAVVDIETTGANSSGNKITEVAIVCVDDGVVTEEWSSLINPERSIPWGITKLTGITDEMVASAPKFFSVAKKIVELTEDRIFVAHNAFFDYRFLQSEFSDLGYTFKRDVWCTVRLSRKAFPGLKSYSLHNLSLHFGLNRLAEHRALDDAKACYEILRLALKTQTIPDEIIADKPLPPGLSDDAVEKLPNSPGTYLFYSQAGLLLYVGKAKRIKDRVKQHFSKTGINKREVEMKSHIARIDYIEWGSELAASLMELQLIKTLKPVMNRAGKKRVFRYTLSLHPEALPGEEIRVSSSSDEEFLRFGSKIKAQEVRQKIYQQAFGVEADGLFFVRQMEQFRKVLGHETVLARLREKMTPSSLPLEDHTVELAGRKRDEKTLIVVRNGALKELQFIDSQGEVEIYALEDFPDMKAMVRSYIDKNLIG
ncbi:MAG: GIY-YIG nuclease family protein [Bacteriovoracaceae bacterium]|nr:GIY-YIG nuclease family protein [Bacteriovoracaceae bacterium]